MRLRRIAATFAGVALLVLTMTALAPNAPARADEHVPDDVAAVFDDDALPSGGARFGHIFRIHHWSMDFNLGRSSDAPLRALDEWIAPYLDADGEALGIVRVWRPSSLASPEGAGHDADRRLATAIHELPTSSTLVEDPRIAAWFAVHEGLIAALNENAAQEAPHPVSAEELMPVVSSRVAASIAGSECLDGAAGSGGGSPVDHCAWYQRIDPVVWFVAVPIVLGVAVFAVYRLLERIVATRTRG